ncbi:low molecular weight phosphatase family protein [Nesterenkonia sandarakina]|uniref:Protein-tyrosine phosphatase n=1 Tax=Nesterenkonia sandarakina TaxID=272918 RepID=A0A7Z0E9B0_9MICC|nr:low molecular weight phosphatase family protein [Nesterenkonia sandarakina]NYJ17426.1 protein-tyrosine phosphatase [Nesterenkonia sandarakina]
MSDVFRILVVCTGNICRSAQAEQLIRARIAQEHSELTPVVEVESAGTGALVGAGMPAEAARLSEQYGAHPSGHVARQVAVDHVRAADLVLVMAAEHRSAVVRLLPRASRNTFLLTEFAALLENAEQNPNGQIKDLASDSTTAKLRAAVKSASARRGYLPLEDSKPVDVIDPYRRSEEVYKDSAQQIVRALDRIQRAAVSISRRISG